MPDYTKLLLHCYTFNAYHFIEPFKQFSSHPHTRDTDTFATDTKDALLTTSESERRDTLLISHKHNMASGVEPGCRGGIKSRMCSFSTALTNELVNDIT